MPLATRTFVTASTHTLPAATACPTAPHMAIIMRQRLNANPARKSIASREKCRFARLARLAMVAADTDELKRRFPPGARP
eukprot:6188090-Pleurochrysis_carterae.AAC.3